ncbi:hypothetical protein L2E82_06333 [Cichorium intybus]|uniref:Uncharacterized protein n=1 Tax=Cichorium intybus TaxID=13427 RepID=A0ACB9HAV3_CICIN|nr:hypothetical protein L2E82_06333 [Cichorium intybus]
MESLSLTTTTTTSNTSKFRFSIPCYKTRRIFRNLPFHHNRHRKFAIFAAKDEDKFDSWDQMELKFGKLIGEDPKLTLAKIIGRKTNPELSFLEIEKLYNKKGLKAFNDIEEVPFDVSDIRRKPKDSLDESKLTRPIPMPRPTPKSSLDGLNLTRPVPKKGVKFEASDKPIPVIPKVKKLNQTFEKAVNIPTESVPNVEIRKPTTFKDDDSSGMLQRPNLSFQINKEQEKKEKLTDMTMVRKPEPYLQKEETEVIEDDDVIKNSLIEEDETNVSLLQKPEITVDQNSEIDDAIENSLIEKDQINVSLLQKPEITVDENSEIDDVIKNSSINVDLGFEMEIVEKESGDIDQESDDLTATSSMQSSLDTALRGPPKRLDQSIKDTSKIEKVVTGPTNPIPYGNNIESENLPTPPLLKEREDGDWKRAENLIKTEGREEVELINSSTRGFVASFGSLIGFLPYRNLATKWKYLAFESWLRKKGLDPAMFRKNLGVIGGYDATSKTRPNLNIEPKKIEGEISPDMKLEDLLAIYDQEKLKYLSTFVGQKVKVNVVLADRGSNKLIFSARPKEKDESVERKRSLMAKLSVGDIVKCSIKKITYYGIFVEIEGVPALIHQTEVSWDDTLDPISYFKIGQVVEAKVHQLDFSLERIFLSLKEITPDPLIESLEAVVGDQANLDGRLEAAQLNEEWPEVESLVKELDQYKGVDQVKKGRFFLSPGLAPTFQVYMASVLENEYKLLARAGNKVQEVIVETSMGKEEMKSAILICASRVE